MIIVINFIKMPRHDGKRRPDGVTGGKVTKLIEGSKRKDEENIKKMLTKMILR